MKLIILTFCLIFCLSSSAQILSESYSSVEINSIDSDDEIFSDLMFLKDLWADKSYVFLGEQSHGEGATFEARVRLIKFLHQEMGFDIIAYESGLYDNYHAYQEFLNTSATLSFKKSILSIWSATAENEKLIDYVSSVANTDHPLQIAGFDFIRNDYYKSEFWDDLKGIIGSRLNSNQQEKLFNLITTSSDLLVENPSDTTLFFTLTEDILSNLDKRATIEPSEHNRLILQTFKSWIFGLKYELNERLGVRYKSQNPRDFQMAENFKFLTQLYPDKKIIGIGASYHFSNVVTNFENTDTTKRYAERIDTETHSHEQFDLDSALNGAVPMGSLLKEELGDRMYSLAFTSFQGSYGLIGQETYQILTPPKQSIESQLAATNLSFIDLSKHNLSSEWFYSSALGNLPVYANWSSIFDGLFFIKTSYPPTPIKYEIDQNATEDTKGLYGSIIDAESKSKIPFVNISIKGTANGTSSNENGDFVFKSNSQTEVDLVFSCIGYENDTISVSIANSKTNLTIKLKPKRYSLGEVVILDKSLSAEDIIKLARKKISENYYQNPFNQEFFFSTSTFRNNDTITFNEEAAILVYGEDGYKSSNSVDSHFFGNVIQMRNTTGNLSKDRWVGIGSFWKIMGHNIIFDKANLLNRSSAYELELIGIAQFEDQLVYEIHFVCTNPNASNIGYGYPAPEAASGKIFINTTDYAIIKYEVCVARKKSHLKKHNTDLYPYGHKLVQTFKKYRGKYFLNTSYSFNHYTYTNLENHKSFTIGELSFLNSTNIYLDRPRVIEKPIKNLGIGKLPKEDAPFWDSFNHQLFSKKIPVFGCE